MKATFAPKDLQAAAQVMQSIVNPTTSLSILRNVLIDIAEDGSATFFASDLEAYAKVTIAGKTDGPGRFTLPARTFADIVKELPPSDVTIEIKRSKATITCEEIDYELATMPADDFPDWPEFTPRTSLDLGQAALREGLSKVSCAIPARDPRKVLLGAFFDLHEDGLRLVSTDGKKLVLIRVACEGVEGEKKHSAIVPSKIVHEILRQLGESGTVKVQFGERQVAFDTGSALYVANVIEGEYPRYEMVIPREFEHVAKIRRDALLADLRRAAIVQDRNEYGVTFSFDTGQLSVAARGHEVGTFAGKLPIEYSGDEFDIVFNYAFLQDLLKAAGGETLALRMNSPSTPAIFHVNDSEDATYLLMPIRSTEYVADGGDDDEDDDEDYADDEV